MSTNAQFQTLGRSSTAACSKAASSCTTMRQGPSGSPRRKTSGKTDRKVSCLPTPTRATSRAAPFFGDGLYKLIVAKSTSTGPSHDVLYTWGQLLHPGHDSIRIRRGRRGHGGGDHYCWAWDLDAYYRRRADLANHGRSALPMVGLRRRPDRRIWRIWSCRTPNRGRSKPAMWPSSSMTGTTSGVWLCTIKGGRRLRRPHRQYLPGAGHTHDSGGWDFVDIGGSDRRDGTGLDAGGLSLPCTVYRLRRPAHS